MVPGTCGEVDGLGGVGDQVVEFIVGGRGVRWIVVDVFPPGLADGLLGGSLGRPFS